MMAMLAAAVTAATLTAALEVPPGEVTVGDAVTLRLTVTHPPGAIVQAPDTKHFTSAGPAGGPSAFEVEQVDPVKLDPPDPGHSVWAIQVRPFAPGEISLPALSITASVPGQAAPITTATEPALLRVRSVLATPEDPPADIKGPWRLPRAWWPWIAAGAAAALLAALAIWAVRRFRSRRRRPAPAPPARPAAPVEPPHVRALRDLERLLASSLLARGMVKEFHVELAEIARRFLGEQLGFDAPDRTTHEVLSELARLAAAPGYAREAQALLPACDLVKFARHHPDRAQIEASVLSARRLIELGRAESSARGAAA